MHPKPGNCIRKPWGKKEHVTPRYWQVFGRYSQVQWAANVEKHQNLRVRSQMEFKELANHWAVHSHWSDWWRLQATAQRLAWRKAWTEVQRPIAQNTTTSAECVATFACHLHDMRLHEASRIHEFQYVAFVGIKKKAHSYSKSIVSRSKTGFCLTIWLNIQYSKFDLT